MTKEEIIALLGRPLTSVEDANFDLYIDIALQSLEELICTPLEQVTETRVFDTREGYSTVFVDYFTEITEVKLNGVPTTDFTKMQWDRRNANWYNSIVFEDRLKEGDEVEVTAEWGFNSIPTDLQLVLANLFGLITKKNKLDSSVKSKKIEDFTVTFKDGVDLDDDFYRLFGRTLTFYSLCNLPYIRQGKLNECV